MKKIHSLTIAGITAFSLVAGFCISNNLQNNVANAEELVTTPEIIVGDDSRNDINVSIDSIAKKTEMYVLQKSSINTVAPAKEDILHMMLNSIDYYNYASGTIAYANPNDLSCAIVVDFQSDIPSSKSYSHIVQKKTELAKVNTAINQTSLNVLTDVNMRENILTDREVYYNADSGISLNNVEKSYEDMSYATISRSNVSVISDDKRFEINENGIPCYYYRANPTNVDDASICLFPQEMAFGFLLDFNLWNIDGSEIYEGRDCVVLSGKTNEDYGNKIGVDQFVFYVDKQTGTLLKYMGYNANGEISDYMVSSNIKFDDSGFAIDEKFHAMTSKASAYSDDSNIVE